MSGQPQDVRAEIPLDPCRAGILNIARAIPTLLASGVLGASYGAFYGALSGALAGMIAVAVPPPARDNFGESIPALGVILFTCIGCILGILIGFVGGLIGGIGGHRYWQTWAWGPVLALHWLWGTVCFAGPITTGHWHWGETGRFPWITALVLLPFALLAFVVGRKVGLAICRDGILSNKLGVTRMTRILDWSDWGECLWRVRLAVTSTMLIGLFWLEIYALFH